MVASVIIPHYDDLANLRVILQLLEQQTTAPQSFEIVVADNNSPGGIEPIRAVAGKRARVVCATEQGAGPARNAGVAAALGDRLAFLDSDCRPASDWLERGLAALDRYDIVGGAVRVGAQCPTAPRPVEAFEIVFAFQNHIYVTSKGFSVTANMFVRRTVFERVGPFRNGLSEDIEWCHRAVARGATLGYASDVVVEHPARRSWEQLVRKWRRTTLETYRLSCEQPFGKIRWILRSWAVLLSPIPHLVTIARSRDLHSLRDKFAAAAVLFRLRAFRFAESYRVMLMERSAPPP